MPISSGVSESFVNSTSPCLGDHLPHSAGLAVAAMNGMSGKMRRL